MDSGPTALDDYRHYTVGWLAPLPIERAAAEALLDEKHGQPRDFHQPPNDTLSYSWGSIGQHNIVIASLKSGIYGTTSAATTASSMLSTFPEIRFGLLVGIGGGIPRPDDGYDIRLGDVVVSDPSGSAGGVVQYDLVKAKAGKRERKDFLNSPPGVLLHALANLKSQHEQRPSKVLEILQEMKQKNPFMFEKKANNPGFGYQGHENDRLFRPSYAHVQGKDCQGCSREEEVDREPRESEEPVIHYGIIASGNTLVKDSIARDELLAHIPEDCICYEMEAAGLMNNFPCIVVRGICDYADSHKNDRWQRYAAATAAAFAKELLGFVRPEIVEKEPRAADSMKDFSDSLREVHEISKDMNSQIRGKGVKEWLNPPDPWRNYQNAKIQRYEDTCHWFLDSEKFESWKTTPNSFLWLYGLPGCGKTILSSAIIQNLCEPCQDQNHAVLYFYFDFADKKKQSCDNMLRSFLFNLSLINDLARREVGKIFESTDGQQPDTKTLRKHFHNVTKCFQDIKIIIDALDEVKDRKIRKELLSWIAADVRDTSGCLHLLVTSRDEKDISQALRDIDQVVHMDNDAVTQDIRKYVRGTISGEVFQRWDKDVEALEDIEQVLTSKAAGMFRWAACQLDILEDCLDRPSLQEALESLPETLGETYSQIIDRIPDPQKAGAIRLLQFLVFSDEIISVAEAIDLIAVDPHGRQAFHPDYRIPNHQDITRYCSSLVIIHGLTPPGPVEPWDEINLAHVTVKEYLMSTQVADGFRQHFQEAQARVSLFHVSLGYIKSMASPPQDCRSEFPLEKYAIWHLMIHARAAERDQTVHDKLLFFLRNHELLRYWIIQISGHTERALQHARSNGGCESDLIPSPLFIAAHYGLERLCDELKNESHGDPIHLHGTDIVPFGFYRHDDRLYPVTALYTAAQQGHEAPVRTLLENSAPLNDRGGPLGTALVAAGIGGQGRVVELILNVASARNCEIDFQGAFQGATEKGHLETIQILLNHRVPTETQYGSAIHAASMAGQEDTIHFLLDDLRGRQAIPGHYSEKVHINSGYSNAIQGTLKRVLKTGLEKSALALLQHIATLPCDEEDLLSALELGDETIPTLLLSAMGRYQREDGNNGDPVKYLISGSRSQTGMMPLHAAVSRGFKSLVQEMIKYDPKLHVQDKEGKTPLHHAVNISEGAESLVQMLIRSLPSSSKQAIFQADYQGRNPFHHAALLGLESIVGILIRAVEQREDGVCTSIGGEERRHIVVKTDHSEKRMKLSPPERVTISNLLQIGDHDMMTPIHLAVANGHIGTTRDLIRAAKTVDEVAIILSGVDSSHKTPLHHAAANQPDLVGTILEAAQSSEISADLLRIKDQFGNAPLHLLVGRGYQEAMELMLQSAPSVEMLQMKDGNGMAPLHLAVIGGWPGEVELIVGFAQSLGFSEDLLGMVDKEGMTPLHHAAQKGDLALMMTLRQAGADPEATDLDGHTPSHHAVLHGGLSDPFRFQFDERPFLCFGEENLLHDSASLLHYAVKLQDQNEVKKIIAEQGEMFSIVVNAKDIQYDRTPLHLAAGKGWYDTVGLFLDWGAEINAPDRYGYTPLDYAVETGHLEIASILLDGGAVSFSLWDETEKGGMQSTGEKNERVDENS